MRIPTRQVIYWGDFAASFLAAGLIFAIAFGLPSGMLGTLSHALHLPTGIFATLAVILAGALLTFALFRLYLRITRSTIRRFLFFETPNGRVHIRARSVEQVINRAVRCMDEVAEAHTSLVLPKGASVPTEVKIRCRLYERPNILGIQDQVRALVCDRYLEMFPSEDPLAVEVTVENINFESPGPTVPPKPQAKRTKKEQEQDEHGHPFRAQYPVGD